MAKYMTLTNVRLARAISRNHVFVWERRSANEDHRNDMANVKLLMPSRVILRNKCGYP